jgi:hypothetical protein
MAIEIEVDAEKIAELTVAKLGRRNNRSDKDRIRTIRKQARDIEAVTKEMEPDDEDAPPDLIQPGDTPVKGEGMEGESIETPVILGTVRAIKAGDDWTLDVLGVPFGGHNGGKDSDGEYFSASTNLYLDRYTPVPLYYHGFDENGRPHGEPQVLGKTVSHEKRADGWWFRVVLDKTSDYAKRVWEAAKQGIARASSGSIAHLVRKTADGHLTHWPAVELSIFDAVGTRQPANQYAVALPVMKAVYAQAGLTLPDDIEPEPETEPQATVTGATAQKTEAAETKEAAPTTKPSSNGVLKMTPEELQALIDKRLAENEKVRADAAKAEKDRQEEEAARTAAAVKAETDRMQILVDEAKQDTAPARRLNDGEGAPYVAKFANIAKFDNLEPADMAFTYGVLKAARRGGHSQEGPSDDLRKALAIALVEDKSTEGEYTAAKRAMYTDLAAKGVGMKANEINQSTLANYGDEWVGVTYSTALWRRIIQPTSIVGRLPTLTVPQGSESIIIPVESTPPVFYKVAQATAQAANPGPMTETITTSKMGTANQTLTVAKMGAASQYTGELEEDSFIPWAAELRQSMTQEAQATLEHVVIDGDTDASATTNINDIGGTPAATDIFLLFNGFRKLALVTNTANKVSVGTLTPADFLSIVRLMGLGGTNAIDRSKVSFIMDVHSHWTAMQLPEVLTRDVFSAPTIEGGTLTSMWGYQTLVSAYMHRANQDATYGLKAQTDGKIDLDTAADNTTGAILAVRWDQWRLGYKRQITFEIERFPRADATSVVAMMRVGMVYRDTDASAIGYNVTLAA